MDKEQTRAKGITLSKKQIKHIAFAWASGLLYATDGTAFMDVNEEINESDQIAIVNQVQEIAVMLIKKAGRIEAISLPRIIKQVISQNK